MLADLQQRAKSSGGIVTWFVCLQFCWFWKVAEKKVQREKVSDAAVWSNKHFVWSVPTPLGCRHGPLPGTTEPAGQVWPAWRCSLDSCCDCQLMKSVAVFSFLPPHFLIQVAFDSSKPESADRLSSRVSVCISQWSSCWEGYKMLSHASICMKYMFIRSEMWNFEQKHTHGDYVIYIFMNGREKSLLMHLQSLQKSVHFWPCWILCGVFIILHSGAGSCALIFPLTCYMWQQEPS